MIQIRILRIDPSLPPKSILSFLTILSFFPTDPILFLHTVKKQRCTPPLQAQEIHKYTHQQRNRNRNRRSKFSANFCLPKSILRRGRPDRSLKTPVNVIGINKQMIRKMMVNDII
jgi:hypothetical protein